MLNLKPLLFISAVVYAVNSYALWPQAFNICNHSHGKYSLTLSGFNNVAWRSDGDMEWNKNTSYEIKEHECMKLFVKANENGYSKLSSLKIAYAGDGGRASFYLNSEPSGGKYLNLDKAHWSLATWWADSDNMKIEAPVSQIFKCQDGSCNKLSENPLQTWIVSENVNKKFVDGSYVFFPNDGGANVQDIALLQTSTNADNYTLEEGLLLSEAYTNLKKLIPEWSRSRKYSLVDLTIRRTDGKNLDFAATGNICRLYDPYVKVNYNKVSLEQAPSTRASALTPLVIMQEEYTNKTPTEAKYSSLEVATSVIKGFSDTSKNTMSFKNTLTLGVSIKVPAVSETSKSVSVELEVAKAHARLSEKQTSQTIITPSNFVKVPANYRAQAKVSLSRENIAGKIYVNYPLDKYNISADWAVDGNCRNKNPNNLVPVKVRLDFLAKNSLDPDKFGSSNGTIVLRDYNEFTTDAGYKYTRSIVYTPLSGAKAYTVVESLPSYYADKVPAKTAQNYQKSPF